MSSFFVYYFCMEKNKINSFLTLAKLFNKNGRRLYLVGGTVRDFLLGKELTDMDATTDATPDEVKTFFTEKSDFTFAKFGAMTLYFDGLKFDVTTLRKEKSYFDSRHPSKIKFVKHPKHDFKRRDFTVNGMYLDEKFVLIDYCKGKTDLENKTLRMIGNPNKRIKEDPLRILRALRFALMFSFHLDEKLAKAIRKNVKLLEKLNIEKIKQEIKKIKDVDENLKTSLFNEFGMISYLDMVK